MTLFPADAQLPTKEVGILHLAGLQKAVGGYIEQLYATDGRVVIVNEEGLIHGLPQNWRAKFDAKKLS